MIAKLRDRLNYGNVVATLGLFVALGTGGAYAANTIRSEDIVNGEVKRADIGGNAVTADELDSFSVGTAELAAKGVTSSKLADDSVGGRAVAPNSLGGSDVVESSLAKVPDADKLDGKDSSAFGGLISGTILNAGDFGGETSFGAVSGTSFQGYNNNSLSPNMALNARRLAVKLTTPPDGGTPSCPFLPEEGEECPAPPRTTVEIQANGNPVLSCAAVDTATTCVDNGLGVIPPASELRVRVVTTGASTDVQFGWQATP